VPTVARAVLDDMVSTATERGGFDHADKLWADWQKLGGETKRTLFPRAGQVAALDDFFLLAKKLKENPNPSGTAVTLNATQLLAGVPGYVLAKALYSPATVRRLTAGMRLAVSPSKAARVNGVAQIGQAVQGLGTMATTVAESPTNRQEARGRR
jgi:anti-sigma factor ChrR (cupin superfamily)